MYNNPNNPTPTIVMPQNSKGVQILVESGTFNMTGLQAYLLMQSTTLVNGVITPGTTVSLTLTVNTGGLSAYYVTAGGEFALPGFYTAQLKVTNNNNILVYSVPYQGQFSLQAPLG